ncbi:glucose import [Tritrichomonas musculus]|uniref:Glucose import n=1 Tax=Tritrichomonas musculus TaxID=1915356 RepID=A0ABR2I7E1_9EUKA
MILSRNLLYILIILSFPLQFVFHNIFFTHGAASIQSNWDFSKISKFQLDFANNVTGYMAAASSLIFIFVSYRIKKRRIFISILYLLSGVIWLVYLAINDKNLWLLILLRTINGVFIGFFQSAEISYMMHFSQEKLFGFHGSLIEVSITLAISLLNVMFYSIDWKIISIILSIQSFAFGGLIWMIPEYKVIPKTYSRQYIYKPPFLKFLIVMISIMAIQCFSGIGFMIENCPRLLKDIGIELDSYIQLAFSNFISCVSAFISAFIIDTIGVRYMWAFSSFGTVISLIIYVITLKVECPKWVGVFGVFLYFLFFGLGEGTIPWMLCGLMFPESLMIESGGINTFVNRFMDSWFDDLLNVITKSIGEFGSVAINAAVSFLGIWFGLFFIPNLNDYYYNENITVF